MTDHKIRSGSLQFWPRKRARKILPRVSWKPVIKSMEEQGKTNALLLGLIAYKAGMVSVLVKDYTEDSLTKSKRIVMPATILECPDMRVFSIRLYKNNKPVKDIIVNNDKILKKKIKTIKAVKDLEKEIKDVEFDDLSVIVYTDLRNSGLNKKSPDFSEIGLNGNKDDKLNLIKEKIKTGGVFSVSDIFSKEEQELVDIRGLTKGKGTQGPVKRFGISLKDHKSEKGRRRPGSLAPWHPSRVTFRAPQAGQMGFQTRISYNQLILKTGSIKEDDINKKEGFHKYGKIKSNYIIVRGSVSGSNKRQLLITKALRPRKKKSKQKYEVLGIR